jgi:rod shape-determining protein MreD
MPFPLAAREPGILHKAVPLVTSAAAAILSVVPVPVSGLAIATPAFALMAVSHWTLYRPDLMPASSVFAIGLLLDLLDGTAYIGLSPLTFLVVRGVVLLGRSSAVNQGFGIVWGGFLAVVTVALGLQWLLIGALSLSELAGRAFVFQGLITVAAYPICDYALAQAQRGLLGRAIT